MATSFLIISAALVALIYSDSMGLLGTTSFVFGVASGSTIILFSVLLVEYFGLDQLPMAIGFHCLVNGLATFPRPLLIGKCFRKPRERDSSWDVSPTPKLVENTEETTTALKLYYMGIDKKPVMVISHHRRHRQSHQLKDVCIFPLVGALLGC